MSIYFRDVRQSILNLVFNLQNDSAIIFSGHNNIVRD